MPYEYEPLIVESVPRWKQIFTRSFIIPQRYVLALMGFFALVNGYTMRLSLAVTITQMVEAPIYLNLTDKTNEPICAFDDYTYLHRNDLQAEQTYRSDALRYDWSQKLQGIILSSFYWGYIFTQIPGGILAQRLGGKIVLIFGLLFAAICTLLTPLCVQYAGVVGLITLRALMGVGEGIMYSSVTVMLSAWLPVNERTTLACFVFGGSTVGTIGGSYLSAQILSKYNDWHLVFYLFGSLTLVWCILFSMLCYDKPESHPFIKDDEKEYLKRTMGYENLTAGTKRHSAPWGDIFTSIPFYALILSGFSQDWAFVVIVLDLPKYLNDVLHFSIMNNGLYTSIPQLLKLIVSLSTGALGDFFISNGYLSITSARKIFISTSSVFSGIFIVLASYAECDKLMVVIFFTISIVFQGVPGITMNPLDLSPNYAGILSGVCCTVGALTGILAPYIVGVITPHSLLTEWRLIFWLTLALQLMKGIVFLFWGSGEVQSWNTPDELKPLSNGKSKSASLSGLGEASGLYGSTRTIDGILPNAISFEDNLFLNNNSSENINKNLKY